MRPQILRSSIIFVLALLKTSVSLARKEDIQELLLILDHPKLITVNEAKRSIEISIELCFEWDRKNAKLKTESGKINDGNSKSIVYWNEEDEFGVTVENVIPTYTSKALQTKTETVQSMRSVRHYSIMFESPMKFDSYPNDSHIFQLRFTSSIKNSSELALNPHFVTLPESEMGTSEWRFEISKSFVQWVVHRNESFEQAVFELQIIRVPSSFLQISITSMFLINILTIFSNFPIFAISSIKTTTNYLIGCQLIILIVSSHFVGMKSLTVFDHQLLSLLLLAVTIEIIQKVLPFFIYHLHCCPIEADPSPPKFPSPSEQFSVDTERSKCNAALDSARAESIKSPRIANFDMCLAEVKFTMASFNEVLNLHASAEWRNKLWKNAYFRFEVIAFIIFQVINILLFSSFF